MSCRLPYNRFFWVSFLFVATVLVASSKCESRDSFEDIVEPLQQMRPRTESDEDRTRAAAKLAMGRICFHHEQYPQALRAFQRAYRYDPHSISVLGEIVPLQFLLNRHDEVARYAVIGAQEESRDAVLMRRLAAFLTESLDVEGALELYEKAAAIESGQQLDATAVVSRLDMGRLYCLLDRFDEAANAFDVVRDAIEHPGKYGIDEQLRTLILGREEITYAKMGDVYLEVGRTTVATKMYVQANEAKENAPSLAYHLARVAVRSGNDDKALESLQKYLDAKAHVEGERPYQLFSEILARQHPDKEGSRPELIERLERLYADDTANIDLAYFLVQQYRAAERWEEMVAVCRDALQLQTDLRGYVGLICALRHLERFEEIATPLGRIIVETGSLQLVGQEAIQQNLDTEILAIAGNDVALDRIFNGCRKLGEEGAEKVSGVCLAAATLALKAKRYEVGDEMIGLEMRNSAITEIELVLTWVVELFTANRYAQAAKKLKEALDQQRVEEEEKVRIYFLLAGALQMAGQTDEAVDAIRKAIELQPESLQLKTREAWILYHAKRHDEAYEKYQNLVDEFDSDHSTRSGRQALREARFALSNLCVVNKEFDQAEEWLEQVLDEFPNNIGALNDLGYLYADQGKYLQRSLKMVTRAVQREPDNVAYMDSLGWTLYKLERYDEAIEYLQKAAQTKDPDGVILDHLGDIYWMMERKQEAFGSWQEATQAFEKAENREQTELIREKLNRHRSTDTDAPEISSDSKRKERN